MRGVPPIFMRAIVPRLLLLSLCLSPAGCSRWSGRGEPEPARGGDAAPGLAATMASASEPDAEVEAEDAAGADAEPVPDITAREINLERFRDAKFGMIFDWAPEIGGGWPTGGAPFDPAQWIDIARKSGARYITYPAMRRNGAVMFPVNYPPLLDLVTMVPDRGPIDGRDPLLELSQAADKAGLDVFLSFDLTRLDARGRLRGMNLSERARTEQVIRAAFERDPRALGIWLAGGRSSRADRRWLDALTRGLRAEHPGLLVGDANPRETLPAADLARRDTPRPEPAGWFGRGSAPAAPVVVEIARPVAASTEAPPGAAARPAEEILPELIRSAGEDANFQLVVRPGPDGRIAEAEAETLGKIGEWFDSFGESIHGTRQGPAGPGPWGVSTAKHSKIYLHYMGKGATTLRIGRDIGDVHEAYEFASGSTLECAPGAEGYELELPGWALSPLDSIVTLEVYDLPERNP